MGAYVCVYTSRGPRSSCDRLSQERAVPTYLMPTVAAPASRVWCCFLGSYHRPGTSKKDPVEAGLRV